MNKTKIDWCDYTWNPLYGCLRGCKYCYAARMHNKRHKAYLSGKSLPKQYALPFDKLQVFPERFNLPYKKKEKSTVFVGSMTDICYHDINDVESVITECDIAYWHKYMFLTKSPAIYQLLKFPENCWLGGTVEFIGNVFDCEAIAILSESKNKTFLSIEPLLGPCCEIPEEIDLVIVGADSSPRAKPPKPEWIQSIKHHNIHWKENIRKYL